MERGDTVVVDGQPAEYLQAVEEDNALVEVDGRRRMVPREDIESNGTSLIETMTERLASIWRE